MIGEKLLHGGDYNPEQWLESQDILEEDIRLMKQAHINCVTLGVFSWSMLEPEEGAYDFQWLKDIIDRLYREGICVILATPSGAMPHWLSQKYPEVMRYMPMESGICRESDITFVIRLRSCGKKFDSWMRNYPNVLVAIRQWFYGIFPMSLEAILEILPATANCVRRNFGNGLKSGMELWMR